MRSDWFLDFREPSARLIFWKSSALDFQDFERARSQESIALDFQEKLSGLLFPHHWLSLIVFHTTFYQPTVVELKKVLCCVHLHIVVWHVCDAVCVFCHIFADASRPFAHCCLLCLERTNKQTNERTNEGTTKKNKQRSNAQTRTHTITDTSTNTDTNPKTITNTTAHTDTNINTNAPCPGATGIHAVCEASDHSYVRRRCLAHWGWRVADNVASVPANDFGYNVMSNVQSLCSYVHDGVTW